MKFKDKSGKVFDDIQKALDNFCTLPEDAAHDECINCLFQASELTCTEFCDDFPKMAARLMGYEVIDDTGEPDAQSITSQINPDEPRGKPKPRICEVLGVEVGERFRIDYPKGMTQWLHVQDNGYIAKGRGSKRLKIGNSVAWAINHPESIIRAPRYTGKEIADAKSIMRLLGVDELFIGRNAEGALKVTYNEGRDEFLLNPTLFPTIRPGHSVISDSITGGDTP